MSNGLRPQGIGLDGDSIGQVHDSIAWSCRVCKRDDPVEYGGGQFMKKLALALVAVLAVVLGSDCAFAQRGGTGHGGGGTSRGGGGQWSGSHGASPGGAWHGGGTGGSYRAWHGSSRSGGSYGSYPGRWHGSGHYGGWSGGYHGHTRSWYGNHWSGGWYGPSVGVYFGGPLWWDGWPYSYYPAYPAYYPYPLYGPDEPNIYIERSEDTGTTQYWFYCPDPAGYYPYVQNCSKPWMTVLPPGAPTPPNPSAPPQ
jgi:hypothetical protein